MAEMTAENRRGYLHEDFRIFRLKDASPPEVEYHYHEFHKLMFLYAGDVEYVVEGQRCTMAPGDLVTVPRGALHRPVGKPGAEYDRGIVYLSQEFLRRESSPECDLEACFSPDFLQAGPVLRPVGRGGREIPALMHAAEQAAFEKNGYGSALLCKARLIQLLIEIARAGKDHRLQSVRTVSRDGKNTEILRYIGENFTEPLSVDALARRFFISRYHLMHRFRQENGVTIHSYILAKRLMRARDLIAAGMPATEACFACGCRDYSAFARAFKKQFGASPRGQVSGSLERVTKE